MDSTQSPSKHHNTHFLYNFSSLANNQLENFFGNENTPSNENIKDFLILNDNKNHIWSYNETLLYRSMNQTDREMFFQPQQVYPGFFVVAYSIIFLLSVFGNILVIVVIRSSKSMRNVPNYFLFNLAIADLMGEWEGRWKG